MSRIVVFLISCGLVAGLQAAPSMRIFITNERSDDISVINGKTLEVEATIPVGGRPRGIGLSPDGQELYVAVSEENSIAVINPATLEVLRKFESGSDPETFAVHPNGNIYISNEDDAKATVFNPITGEQVAEIPVGLEPEGVAISPDGSKVIVTSESTNMLHIIGVPEHTIVANVLVGARPRSAVFNADGSLAYSTSEISGEVKKVDVETGAIIGKMSLGDDKAKPKSTVNTVCPAVILANSLTDKEIGFANILIISIGTISGIKTLGTPGGTRILKKWPPCLANPMTKVMRKIPTAKTPVTTS